MLVVVEALMVVMEALVVVVVEYFVQHLTDGASSCLFEWVVGEC